MLSGSGAERIECAVPEPGAYAQPEARVLGGQRSQHHLVGGCLTGQIDASIEDPPSNTPEVMCSVFD